MAGRGISVARCSFCGKAEGQVQKMIAGPAGLYICNECVALCREIIEEDERETGIQVDPDILLMDEPFGSLDDMTREQMDMAMLDIWQKTGKTIIFITHSVEEAVLMSSRIYVMATNPGRLTEVVDIDLPRPRTLDMIVDEKFIRYENQLTELIGELDLSKIK